MSTGIIDNCIVLHRSSINNYYYIRCVCDTGYVFDGNTCVDENECESADQDPCGEHGACWNIDGSYE